MSQYAHRGHRNLHQTIVSCSHNVWPGFGLKEAAVTVVRRKHTGVVFVAGLRHNIEHPPAILSDAEPGRPESYDLLTDAVLQDHPGPDNIIGKRPASHAIGENVGISM